MPPTCALVLAVSLFAPPVPTQISPAFNPVLQLLPDPLHKGQSTPCLCGQLFFLADDGRFTTPNGELYVLLESLKVKGGSKEPIPEVFHFDSATLAKLKTKDERFGDCYTVALPWPKEWKNVVQVKSSVKFVPTAKGQPELVGPPQTILVDPPEADAPKVASAVRCCTANFEVRAPGDKLAAQVAKEAERQRKLLAEKWLGKELPKWDTPCEIEVKINEKRTGGATTFTFGTVEGGMPGLNTITMSVFGPGETVLKNVLPHEVMHCVLATTIGSPVPRWVDEGIGVLAEANSEQAEHDRKCREYLDAGRGFRLNKLLTMKDYPKDIIVLFAQGHSVTRFLLTRKLRLKPGDKRGPLSQEQALVYFVGKGMEDGWDEAVKAVYGFDGVGELEEAWLAWMHTPGSILRAENAEEKTLSVEDDMHIPPTKLPK